MNNLAKYARLFFILLVPLFCFFALFHWITKHTYYFQWKNAVIIPTLIADIVLIWLYVVLGEKRLEVLKRNWKRIAKWTLIIIAVIAALVIVAFLSRRHVGDKPVSKHETSGRVLTREEFNAEYGSSIKDPATNTNDPDEEACIQQLAKDTRLPVSIVRAGHEDAKKFKSFDKNEVCKKK